MNVAVVISRLSSCNFDHICWFAVQASSTPSHLCCVAPPAPRTTMTTIALCQHSVWPAQQSQPVPHRAHLTTLPAPQLMNRKSRQSSHHSRTQPVAVRLSSTMPTSDVICFITTTATGCEGRRLRLSGASFLCHFPTSTKEAVFASVYFRQGRI